MASDNSLSSSAKSNVLAMFLPSFLLFSYCLHQNWSSNRTPQGTLDALMFIWYRFAISFTRYSPIPKCPFSSPRSIPSLSILFLPACLSKLPEDAAFFFLILQKAAKPVVHLPVHLGKVPVSWYFHKRNFPCVLTGASSCHSGDGKGGTNPASVWIHEYLYSIRAACSSGLPEAEPPVSSFRRPPLQNGHYNMAFTIFISSSPICSDFALASSMELPFTP